MTEARSRSWENLNLHVWSKRQGPCHGTARGRTGQSGLRRARWALTGGSPLGPDTFRFFRSIGINLKQVYGSTETTGLVSIQPNREANPTTAGRATLK